MVRLGARHCRCACDASEAGGLRSEARRKSDGNEVFREPVEAKQPRVMLHIDRSPAQLSEPLQAHHRASSGPLEASSALKLHQDAGPLLTTPLIFTIPGIFVTSAHALSSVYCAKITCWHVGVSNVYWG